MAIVPDTHDFSAGIVTSSEMNTYVRDPIRFMLTRPIFQVRQIVAQSVANNTWTSITFTEEDVDSDPSGSGGHSNTTNTSRFTAVYPGYYRVGGVVAWDVNSTGARGARWAVNGTPLTSGAVIMQSIATFGPAVPAPSQFVYLHLGDYVELQGWQNSGGALTTQIITGGQSVMTGIFENS